MAFGQRTESAQGGKAGKLRKVAKKPYLKVKGSFSFK